jgi:hypothetical protein
MSTAEFQYLSSAETSKLFDLVLQLATELHVANTRIRALEYLMVRRGLLAEQEVDQFTPEAAEGERLSVLRDDYLARLVRIITENGPAEHPLRDQWEAALAGKRES